VPILFLAKLKKSSRENEKWEKSWRKKDKMTKRILPEPDPELIQYFRKYNELDLFKILIQYLRRFFGAKR